MKENLLIVGNGFDLACELESGYTSFFESRISNEVESQLKDIIAIINQRDYSYKSIYFEKEKLNRAFSSYATISEDMIDKIKNAELTFWDIVFYCFGYGGEKNNWHYVEDNIKKILSEIKLDLPYSDMGFKKNGFASFEKNKSDGLFRTSCIIAYYIFPEERYCKLNDFDEFLQKELTLFEDAFEVYLIGKLHGAYETNAYKLLKEIVGETQLSDKNYSVISFNYTEPDCFQGEVTNVHGKLGRRNIIFGIDQRDVDPNSLLFKYTKTVRKLIQNKKEIDDVVHINNKNGLKNIFFHGHSLSSLDYSYFQSIFDYYDIYDSGIKLTFCCSRYDGKSTSEILSEHADLVGKLLRAYGETTGNEHKGENLLHKLLLEGRLEIKEVRIPSTPY